METFAAGYAIVWVALVVYVGWIAGRQRRLSRQVAELQRQIEAEHQQQKVKKTRSLAA